MGDEKDKPKKLRHENTGNTQPAAHKTPKKVTGSQTQAKGKTVSGDSGSGNTQSDSSPKIWTERKRSKDIQPKQGRKPRSKKGDVNDKTSPTNGDAPKAGGIHDDMADTYDRLRALWRNREDRVIELDVSAQTLQDSRDSIKHLFESGLIDIAELDDHDVALAKLASMPEELESYKQYMSALADYQRDVREHKQRMDERLHELQQFTNTLSNRHGLKQILLRRSLSGKAEALTNGVRIVSDVELSGKSNREFSESLTKDVFSRPEYVKPLFYVTPEHDRKFLGRDQLDDLQDGLDNLIDAEWRSKFQEEYEIGRSPLRRQAADLGVHAKRVKTLLDLGLIDPSKIDDVEHTRKQLTNHPDELKVYEEYAKVLNCYQNNLNEMNRRHDAQVQNLQELITNYTRVFEIPEIKVTRHKSAEATESTFKNSVLTLSDIDLDNFDVLPKLVKRLLQSENEQ